MNKKIEYYAFDAAGFHTLEITFDGALIIKNNIPPEINRCIDYKLRKKRNETKYITVLRINPNKLKGSNYIINSYKELKETLLEIITKCGFNPKDAILKRADFRFDSFDREHYTRYAKLHRLLISLITISEQMENDYITFELFDDECIKSICANSSSKHIEIECYDKELESRGHDPAKTRLEIRSTAMASKNLKHEFTITWKRRWCRAKNCLSDTLEQYNDKLESNYRKYKDSYPVHFRNLNEFTMQYQQCFFTTRQLSDFYSRFPDEVKNPTEKAKNYKKRYGLETFSKKDVQQAISVILEGIEDFFSA